MAISNVISIDSKRSCSADELISVIKEDGKQMQAGILLYASGDGKLNFVAVGELNELEILGWLQYASVKFMGTE